MNIQTILSNSYDYVVIPKSVLEVPVELSKLAKLDENGVVTGHYSIGELSRTLGSLFVPIDIIDERFTAFRWSFDRNREEALVIDYLKALGLVNMREKVGELDKTVGELDYNTLNGNEFGIFSIIEFKQIPYTPPIIEEPIL